MTEYATVMQELNFFINNTVKLARAKNTSFDLLTFPNKTEIRNRAFGVCLIISPWNYPFNLSMIPVIDAIAAGNSVYLMMSRKNPKIRELMKEVLKPVEDIVHLENERSYDEVLEEKFDFYFFTGSKNRGQAVYKKAAENLKPCVLELGGKSPCIVDKDVDLEDVAKKCPKKHLLCRRKRFLMRQNTKKGAVAPLVIGRYQAQLGNGLNHRCYLES